MTKELCDTKHKQISTILRYLILGVLTLFTAISSLYLYSSEKFVTKSEMQLVRESIRDIKTDLAKQMTDGFDRLEKRLP